MSKLPSAPEGEAQAPEGKCERLLKELESFGAKLGLERIGRLLEAMGSPQLHLPVVLVAGTNGKGSTTALLAAMSRAAGYRTGHLISPHLEHVRERIQIDGRPLTDTQLLGHLEGSLALAKKIQGEPPTYFEALTLAAFRAYQQAEVELVVMEVGLGGRLDATNASEPILSLITSIGFDHMSLLGSTLSAIAGEKAGIMRAGRPVIAWSKPDEVHGALSRAASQRGAVLTAADQTVEIEPIGPVGPPQRARLRTAEWDHELELHLPGRHQLRNLALATLAAETLRKEGWEKLDDEAIQRGAAACRWPGRLEWITLPDGRAVLLDAAHNPQGVQTLTRYLDAYGKPMDMLFGALGEKRISDMLPPLAERTERLTLTRPPNPRRARDPRDWLPLLAGKPAAVLDDPAAALDHALTQCRERLLVCGSLYLVGEIRGLLREHFGVPEPTVAY